MPRGRGSLIEAMRQEALAKSGEVDTNYQITKEDIVETSTAARLDERGKDVKFDAAIAADPNVIRPVVNTIAVTKLVPLYRQALDAGKRPMPGVYLIRMIPYGNVSNCLRKKSKTGQQVFFRDIDLNGMHNATGGWRVWTALDNKFPCWSEGCVSRMPHIEALYSHIRDGHADLFPHYRHHLETLLYQDAQRRTGDVNEFLKGTGLHIDKLVVGRAPNNDAAPDFNVPAAAVDNRPFESEHVPIPVVDDPGTVLHELPAGFRSADQSG